MLRAVVWRPSGGGRPLTEPVRIELAGRVRLEGSGTAVEGSGFPGRQGRLALAYLALEARSVGRDELAAAVWGDALPRSWERDLSAVVSKLRALLAPAGARITGGGADYRLELPAGAELDVLVAEAAVADADAALAAGDAAAAVAAAGRAVEVARRELLPGLRAPWVDERREDLRRLLRRSLEVRADAAAVVGDLEGARRDATELVALDPYRETGHARLIRLELRAGNRAEALRGYERCRRLLADELGVPPGAEVEAAYVEALQAEDGAAVPVAAGATPFVGRRAELARLADELAAAASGATRVAVVTGEAGIGKSRLAAEFTRARSEGVTLLMGRCDAETVVPYRPWAEALRPLMTPAAARSDPLRRLFPEQAAAAEGDAGDPQLERFRLFEAVAALLRRAGAERPVVVVVEDLQWADRASVLLLRHLARAQPPARLLVVATSRDGAELPDATVAALTDLEHDGRLARVQVGALAVEDVLALLATVRADAGEDLGGAVHAATGGNPWFVGELLGSLAGVGDLPALPSGEALLRAVGVPRAAEEVVLGHLGGLPEDAREVIRAAAVVGGDLDPQLLGRVTGLDEARVLDVLELAAGARLVRPTPAGGYRLAHALVREALYASVPAGERLRLHRRAGDALESLHADQLDAHLGALTRHLALAATPGRLGRVVEFSERAGERALAQLAYDEAAHHYRAALELLDLRAAPAGATRCRLLLGLADACIRAGAVEEARRALDEAAAVARASGATGRLAEAALAYGNLPLDEGLEGGAVAEPLLALLDEALAACPPGDSPERAQLLARIALELYFSDQPERRASLVDEAEAMARRVGDEAAIAGALTARCYELLGSPDVARRAGLADELVQRRAPAARENALRWKVWDHLEAGDLAAAEAAVARVAEDAERRGIDSSRWYPKVWAATRALLRGPLDRVESLAAEALEVGRRSRGPDAVFAVYSAQLFALRLLQGRLGELEEVMAAYADASPNRPVWRAALAFAQADAGRLAEAGATFEQLAERGFDALPQTVDLPPALTLLGWTCGRLGDAARAADLYERTLPYADLLVVVGVTPAVCAGSFHHPLGTLAAAAGDVEAADAHLAAAVACDDRLCATPWAARARLDRARLLHAAGWSKEAGRVRAEVVAAAEDLGLPGLAARARTAW
jgi:DNA-binding SARP family transcriptional activator